MFVTPPTFIDLHVKRREVFLPFHGGGKHHSLEVEMGGALKICWANTSDRVLIFVCLGYSTC